MRDAEDIVLLDVTPQLLGIELIHEETGEEYYNIIIPRNSPIPARETDMTSTIRRRSRIYRVSRVSG